MGKKIDLNTKQGTLLQNLVFKSDKFLRKDSIASSFMQEFLILQTFYMGATMKMFKQATIFFLGCFLLIPSLSIASAEVAARADVQKFMTEMVEKHHFTKKELNSWFTSTTLQPKIIEAMNRPAEKKAWHQYRPIFLTPQQIENGVQFWKENKEALARAEATYGVPAEMIIAIIGVETRYGKNQGSYKVIDALSTLAFDYPPRATFFRGELEQYLLLCREQKFEPLSLKGSYAGAMGISQFIPSSYRHYAVHFDKGPGTQANLFENTDAIGSVAHYFKQHGWKAGQPIASPAKVSGSTYKTKLANYSNPTPNVSIKTWKEYGVSARNAPPSETLAALLQLEQADKPEYWMTYQNFYVITRYNHSSLYAMAATQLSEKIREAYEKGI